MLRPSKPISMFLVICLAGGQSLSQFLSQGAAADNNTLTREAYESCQTQDETEFRDAIERVTTEALVAGTKNLDFSALVGDAWRTTDFDKTIDKQVDKAAESVRNETSWGSLISSLTDSKQAKELATAVAERTYRSKPIKSEIERLAETVGIEVGRQVELAAIDASKPTLACLQAFLGNRYGQSITTAVTSQARRDFQIDGDGSQPQVNSGTVIRQSAGGLTGAAILLIRRQMANMAQRIGARLVGSVLSRLVSVVAGGVGVVLIAKDLWELRNGVLPIIADEMKSPATKASVREELAKNIGEEIQAQIRDIGRNTAERVIAVWREFKSAHTLALSLAETNSEFKVFLETVATDRLAQLDEVISIIRSKSGKKGILDALEDGSLEHAVKRLPQEGLQIARETREVDKAIRWHQLAGHKVSEVVDVGLHRNVSPEILTQATLEKVLSLEDEVAITRIAKVSQETRALLFELPRADLKALARTLSKDQLTTLAAYLSGLETSPRQSVLKAIADAPQKMLILSSDRVRRAIVASSDQAAAVNMMLRSDEGVNAESAMADFELAWEGRVSPVLLWDKHPSLVVAFVIFLIIIVLILRRVFTAGKSNKTQSDKAVDEAVSANQTADIDTNTPQ